MEPMTTGKILLVDDDENILQGYYRSLHRHFPIEVARGGESALRALEDHGPFAVLIADMRMPGMDGLQLLKIVKRRWPQLIRIMLTGNSDQTTAADAVNQGEVFRFLTKPCTSDQMQATIIAALQQFHLVQAEKNLLENTLLGSIRVLTDLLGLLDPEVYGCSQLIAERARVIGRAAGMDSTWALEVAAMLAPIGGAVLPRILATKVKDHRPLTPQESALVDRIPEFGAKLLETIPLMEEVAAILRQQAPHTEPSDNTLESRILRTVSEFTRRERLRKDGRVVLEDMRLAPEGFDPGILPLLDLHFGSGASNPMPVERALALRELQEGMVLGRNALDLSGQIALLAGLRLGGAHLDLLKTLHELGNLDEPIYVLGQ